MNEFLCTPAYGQIHLARLALSTTGVEELLIGEAPCTVATPFSAAAAVVGFSSGWWHLV
ncbi:hypothetical protein SBV1_1160005 [Verrucomicrobia bacterium]|nr:hypothetical protein SBV1_1160005 [Verrucomicrobiota bacterium]